MKKVLLEDTVADDGGDEYDGDDGQVDEGEHEAALTGQQAANVGADPVQRQKAEHKDGG